LAIVALALITACGKSKTNEPGIPAIPSPAQRSQASQANTPGAFFQEATDSARLHFVHQLADGKLSNIVESDGAGGVILDFDGDGFYDVYLVNSGPDPLISEAPAGTPREPNRLYRNRGDGTFEDVTQKAGVAGHGFGITAAAADYDNDGDTDLYVVNYGGGILYRNRADGTFEDVTAAAGLIHRRAGISATFLDYNRDGFLDLFVATYLVYDPKVPPPPGGSAPYAGPLAYPPELNLLYRNRGNGTFEDVSERTGIRLPGHRAMSVTAFDYDLDGDTDIYVSNDATANLLLANNGQGQFQEVGLETGTGFNQFGVADGSMGAVVGDCNGDGLPDMLVTRFGNASLYLNSRGGFFEDRIQSSGILAVSSKYTGWGGCFSDFDNDGDLDVLIVNGHAHFLQGMPTLWLENRGDGSFTDASAKGGPFFHKLLNARGSGAFDADNDGRMDVLITTLGDRAVFLRNAGQTGNHWLCIQLEGTRGNRDGFGAQVRVTVRGRTQSAEARCPTSYVFQQDPRLHFGLGPQATADLVEIRWPSGQTQTLSQVAADQVLKVREPEGTAK
jgi:hypothetical protein